MNKFRMTFTADTYGEDFLESGELDLFEEDPEHPCNIRSEHLIFSIGLILGGVKRRTVTAGQASTLLNLCRAQT